MAVEAREPARLTARPDADVEREALVTDSRLLVELVRDPGERTGRACSFDRFRDGRPLTSRQVGGRGGVEDDGEEVRVPLFQKLREELDVVALDELGWLTTDCRNRAAQALQPLRLVGPDERLEQSRPVVCRDVDGGLVDPDAAPHLGVLRE